MIFNRQEAGLKFCKSERPTGSLLDFLNQGLITR